MQESLEIVPTEGEPRLDSRLLAKQLGYEHKVMLQAIRRHKGRLEAKSFLLQFEAKTTGDERGRGRPEVHYMLNERQCLILCGSLKKGVEAEEWHDRLVDAFLQARARIRELEAQSQGSPATLPPAINSLWQERLERFHRQTRIPEGYWCIFGMVASFCWTEEFRDVHLVESALPDGSVGKMWCDYLREHGYDMSRIKKYPHRYPDKRAVQLANIYPNEWLGAFWTWFHGYYLKVHYPEYLRTHALALPAAQERESLPMPKKKLPREKKNRLIQIQEECLTTTS